MSSLESWASGASGCIDDEVDVMRDILMSRPANEADGGSEDRPGAVDEVNGDGLRVRRRRW